MNFYIVILMLQTNAECLSDIALLESIVAKKLADITISESIVAKKLADITAIEIAHKNLNAHLQEREKNFLAETNTLIIATHKLHDSEYKLNLREIDICQREQCNNTDCIAQDVVTDLQQRNTILQQHNSVLQECNLVLQQHNSELSESNSKLQDDNIEFEDTISELQDSSIKLEEIIDKHKLLAADITHREEELQMRIVAFYDIRDDSLANQHDLDTILTQKLENLQLRENTLHTSQTRLTQSINAHNRAKRT